MVDIGFIGLGHMGFPMAGTPDRCGYDVVAFDTRTDALDGLVALGARPTTLKDEGATPFSRPRSDRSRGRPASPSATPKSENDIIGGEEQHYSHRVRLWPLSGAINNRNAYGKPVD
jgi:NAD binding domain of 6-phosphogluconate dehydrogenase